MATTVKDNALVTEESEQELVAAADEGAAGQKRRRPPTIECKSPAQPSEKRLCMAGIMTPASQASEAVAAPGAPDRSISPSQKRASGRWTKAEDEKLRSYVNDHGPKNWKEISLAAFGGTRTDVQCLHRWQKVLKPGLVKGPWSTEEDTVVLEMVTAQGGAQNCKWSVIAAALPGRLGKQVRERWYNHLDPSLTKAPWSEDEDRLLISLQAVMGNRWSEIAKAFSGRSENSVKNRWNSKQRRHGRSSSRAASSSDKGKATKAKRSKKSSSSSSSASAASSNAAATPSTSSSSSSSSSKRRSTSPGTVTASMAELMALVSPDPSPSPSPTNLAGGGAGGSSRSRSASPSDVGRLGDLTNTLLAAAFAEQGATGAAASSSSAVPSPSDSLSGPVLCDPPSLARTSQGDGAARTVGKKRPRPRASAAAGAAAADADPALAPRAPTPTSASSSSSSSLHSGAAAAAAAAAAGVSYSGDAGDEGDEAGPSKQQKTDEQGRESTDDASAAVASSSSSASEAEDVSEAAARLSPRLRSDVSKTGPGADDAEMGRYAAGGVDEAVAVAGPWNMAPSPPPSSPATHRNMMDTPRPARPAESDLEHAAGLMLCRMMAGGRIGRSLSFDATPQEDTLAAAAAAAAAATAARAKIARRGPPTPAASLPAAVAPSVPVAADASDAAAVSAAAASPAPAASVAAIAAGPQPEALVAAS